MDSKNDKVEKLAEHLIRTEYQAGRYNEETDDNRKDQKAQNLKEDENHSEDQD